MQNNQFDARQFTKGKFLKADDLDRRRPTFATIQNVEPAEFEGQKPKLVLSFRELDQSMACNKTQTDTLIELFGYDWRLWTGKQVNLRQGKATYLGKPVATIVIDEAEPVAAAASTVSTDEDDMPF